MKKILFYIAFLFSLYSCGFVYERKLTGNYYLVGIDSKKIWQFVTPTNRICG